MLIKQILQAFVLEHGSEPTTPLVNGDSSELDCVTLASITEGYTASDMRDLVEGAQQQAVIRTSQSGDSRVSDSLRECVSDRAQ